MIDASLKRAGIFLAGPHMVRHVWLLLACSFLLLVGWSLIIPIYEAPDENHHWEVARYINEHGRLPFYDDRIVEANQPPLYYLLIAPLAEYTKEPLHGTYRDPQGNVVQIQPPKYFLNSFDDFAKYWPIRISRLFTALLSVGTVLFAYLTGVVVTGNRAAGILAGWMTALLPQFTFRGMNVSNDALVTVTSAAALYLIMLLAVDGHTRKREWICGVVMGLALSSKLNSIFLPGLYVIATLSDASVPFISRMKRMWVLGVAAIILSPFVVRNLVLYGEPFATSQMLVAVRYLVDKKPISSPYFRTMLPEWTLKSFVGVLGWMNVFLPSRIYTFFAFIALGAVAGLIWALVRRRVKFRTVGLLALAPLMACILLVHLNLTFTQPQGRFLFPALSAVAVLTAMGVQSFPWWRPVCTTVLILIMAGVNLYVAGAVVLPAYWTMPNRRAEFLDVCPREALEKTRVQLSGKQSVIQHFTCRNDNLSRVDVLMPTWGRKVPSGSVTLRLMEEVSEPRQAAAAIVSAAEMVDNTYVSFSFAPIPNSKDRRYYMILESQGVPPGYQIGVWMNGEDVYPEGEAKLDTRTVPNDAVFRTYYTPRN